MASKSKSRNKKVSRNYGLGVIGISSIAALLALLQNSYGQFSDIRGYYGLRFADGQHAWPFMDYTLMGATEPTVAVQYPALIGLIMWIFSFFIEPAQYAWVDYFRLTAAVQIFIFSGVAYLIYRLSNMKAALLFICAPAVLYSLNRNWDIWAVLTMLIAILYFQRNKFSLSAFFLAVSIATKFFPVVLLLPICVYFYKNKEIKRAIKFLLETSGYWFIINLPFMLINFKGWFAFYDFNFKRPIGSASIFEVTSIIGINLPTSKFVLYSLNIFVLFAVFMFLIKYNSKNFIFEGSFFVMFAFMLFNKQYSMQYIIWLAALAVLGMSRVAQKNQKLIVSMYVIWQALDLLFQYSFFQRILTGIYANSDTPASPAISSAFYGSTGVIRYVFAILFTVILGLVLIRQEKQQIKRI
jgi:uncharacterized membrane protein